MLVTSHEGKIRKNDMPDFNRSIYTNMFDVMAYKNKHSALRFWLHFYN